MHRVDRQLLACGIASGIVFFVVGLGQAFTRAGFDLRHNAISQLSLGDLGWLQITSFIVTGLLAIACAVGARRALDHQPGGTWGPRLIGMFGLGLIIAGFFPPDPGFGFPPGAPAGAVMPMSTHAMLHAVGFFVSMLGAIAGTIVFARRFAARGETGWAAYCVASAVAAPLLIALSIAFMSWGGVIVACAGAVPFGWVAAMAARLRAEGDDGYRSVAATQRTHSAV